eukprot:704429-Prymnesium_polylepis.1
MTVRRRAQAALRWEAGCGRARGRLTAHDVAKPRADFGRSGKKPKSALDQLAAGEGVLPRGQEAADEHVAVVLTATRLEGDKVERREDGERESAQPKLVEANPRSAQCPHQEGDEERIAGALPEAAHRPDAWQQRARERARPEQIVPRDEEELHTEAKRTARGIRAERIAQNVVDEEALKVLLAEERLTLVAQL